MTNAKIEVAQAQYFDFVVINALFESALFDLKAIVHSTAVKILCSTSKQVDCVLCVELGLSH